MAVFKNVYDIYKIGHKLTVRKVPVIPKLLSVVKRIIFPACDIPFTAQIGENAYFPHRAIGVVIHGKAVIGDNATIHANVVIAGKNGETPTIGDNCMIGAGACILGGVKIGNNCVIAAGAVVVDDIPDNKVVGGIPAKVIKDTAVAL